MPKIIKYCVSYLGWIDMDLSKCEQAYIFLLAIRISYLRSNVIRCSTKRGCFVAITYVLFAHAEISNFNVSVTIQQHVV